ncbi:hypothetical protein B0H10DRAFT_985785 [Mycena sp. CBHHK59/15]|nr:hypothetical protein B0H10DRAFT_985785 [Mycena sp. CBHHK59/15]
MLPPASKLPTAALALILIWSCDWQRTNKEQGRSCLHSSAKQRQRDLVLIVRPSALSASASTGVTPPTAPRDSNYRFFPTFTYTPATATPPSKVTQGGAQAHV